jgi:hypothetical protein
MPSIMTLQGPRLAEFTCLSGDCGTLQGAYVDTLKRHWLLIGVSLVAGAYLTVGLPTIKRRLGLRGPRARRR